MEMKYEVKKREKEKQMEFGKSENQKKKNLFRQEDKSIDPILKSPLHISSITESVHNSCLPNMKHSPNSFIFPDLVKFVVGFQILSNE